MKAHFIFHESKASYGKPWYIPGYGTRGTTFAGAINLIYTLPLSKKQPESHDSEE